MKEIIIKSIKYPTLVLQIFNDKEFGMLGENEVDNDFLTDNKDYAYEVFKLLKEANKRGCFDELKEDDCDNVIFV